MRFDTDGRRSRHQHRQQYLSSSSSEQLLLKFQTAYSDIEDRRKRILTFDIEKIDSSISLTTADCLCILGERKYTNAILIRLCVRASLLSPISKKEQHGGLLKESAKKVIFIDAGVDVQTFICV
jgi:hypothetical protein